MKTILLLLGVSIGATLFAQKNPTELAQPIVAEGKLLYKSEMASWFGTDIFLEKFSDMNIVGGYFSYTEGDTSTCIFFSDAEKPEVLGEIQFDTTFNPSTAKVDLERRSFTNLENNLFVIRSKALDELRSDTMFTRYNNTDFNLIPVIKDGERKVYVLTGTASNGVVLFGNDYLLTFDAENNLLTKKRIHQNLIPVYLNDPDAKNAVGTIHSHLPETGDFMTATDICTAMLYQDITHWETITVVSEKYMNIWNCRTNTLTVVEKDIFKKIDEDQEKRHGNKEKNNDD